jgi:hypothetical protein
MEVERADAEVGPVSPPREKIMKASAGVVEIASIYVYEEILYCRLEKYAIPKRDSLDAGLYRTPGGGPVI